MQTLQWAVATQTWYKNNTNSNHSKIQPTTNSIQQVGRPIHNKKTHTGKKENVDKQKTPQKQAISCRMIKHTSHTIRQSLHLKSEEPLQDKDQVTYDFYK